MLTFEQIENAFPESEINFIDGHGKNSVNPQWLHEFARAIELLVNQENQEKIEGQREVITDLEDRLEKAQVTGEVQLVGRGKEIIVYVDGEIQFIKHIDEIPLAFSHVLNLQPSQSQVSDDLLKHAKHYRDHYLLDEIDEPELCIDKAQHDALLAFSSAIDRALQSIPADTKGGE